MIIAVAFVVAAGAGAVMRAEAGHRWNRHEGMAWGTVVVNVVGAFGLGLLHEAAPPVLTVAGVAGLGALTTFSSFARDVVALADARKAAACAAYLAVSLTAGVGAAALGMAIAW